MEHKNQDKSRLAEQYDKFADKFNELYWAGKLRGRDSMTAALDKAHEHLVSLGEFTTEQGEELKQYLARDLDQTIVDAQQLGDEAKERFHPARLGAGALSSIAAVLEFGGDALRSLSSKAKESLGYRTGEMSSAGTLTCQACGQTVQLKQTGHVPPCPKCSATLFSKGY
ncbi:hypothetical protein GCM10027046_03200 [Uliginosibacterium flavum]|uniref:Zinc ribbon-containing protein n=1 Tax=Uliginosibacterium flavum TaxID=1396831 RepID=A0ABV2TJK2_9RHOO